MWNWLLATIFLIFLGCGGGKSPEPLPPGPSGLAYTVLSESSIRLTWAAPTNRPDGYEIERRTGSGGFEKVHFGLFPVELNYAQYDLENTVPDLAQLTFRIRAIAGGKASAYSNEVSWTTGLRAPRGPYASLYQNSILVTWTNPSWGANSTFILERKIVQPDGQPSGWQPVQTTAGATSYTESGLQEGCEYLFRAYNRTSSAQSRQVESAVVQVPLRAPTGVTVSPLPEGVAFQWQNNSVSAAAITVLRQDPRYGDYEPVATLPANATSFQHVPVAPGEYSYKIAASTYRIHFVGAAVPATSLPLPAPTGVRCQGQPGSVRLTWTAAGTYTTVVERKPIKPYAPPWAVAAEIPAGTTDHTDLGLEPGIFAYRLGTKGSFGTYFGPESQTIVTPTWDDLRMHAKHLPMPPAVDAWLSPNHSWWLWGVDGYYRRILYRPTGGTYTAMLTTDPYLRWAQNPVQFDAAGNPTVYYMASRVGSGGWEWGKNPTRARWNGSQWSHELLTDKPVIPPGNFFAVGTNENPIVLWENDLTALQQTLGRSQIEWTHAVQGSWPVALSPLGPAEIWGDQKIWPATTDQNGLSYLWVNNRNHFGNATYHLFSITSAGIWNEILPNYHPSLLSYYWALAPAKNGFGLFYYDKNQPYNSYALKFRRYKNGGWGPEELVDQGTFQSWEDGISKGVIGGPQDERVALVRMKEGKVVLTIRRPTGEWTTSALFEGFYPQTTKIQFDEAGKLVILIKTGWSNPGDNVSGWVQYGFWEED